MINIKNGWIWALRELEKVVAEAGEIEQLDSEAELADVIAKVNEIISALQTVSS